MHGNYCGFAVKPFSSKHLCKYLKVLETVYNKPAKTSTKMENKDFSKTMPQGQGPSFQRQGLTSLWNGRNKQTAAATFTPNRRACIIRLRNSEC